MYLLEYELSLRSPDQRNYAAMHKVMYKPQPAQQNAHKWYSKLTYKFLNIKYKYKNNKQRLIQLINNFMIL